MDNSRAELERMEEWIGGIMAGLSTSSRTRAARNIASGLRGMQAKRIAAQRNPDGSAFEARKKSAKAKPSNAPLKFLYPAGGNGAPRVVLLKSWIKQGPVYTGFDIEAGGIRSFDKSKITKWLRATEKEGNKTARPLRTRSSIKSRIMFRKLRTYGLLKSGSNANEAWAGFSGRAAQIAGVHQEGGFDQPGPKAPRIRYAQRKLLGLAASDERQILNMLVEMIDSR
jgi:hypothetical protein